jgi:biopolymer transport protein TolR
MTDVPLSPAQRARIRRLSTPAEPDVGADAGELNVVPYLDIVMNIMMFVLVSVSVAFTSSIGVAAASTTPGKTRPPEGLRLTALVTAGGVALKTAGGSLAPGCEGAGAGITVPSRGGAYDLAGLTACARRVKAWPEAAGETQVSVAASPEVPYETVIAVIDALRADGEGTLFPDVSLGAVR